MAPSSKLACTVCLSCFGLASVAVWIGVATMANMRVDTSPPPSLPEACQYFNSNALQAPVTDSVAANVIDAVANFSVSNDSCPMFLRNYRHPLKWWTPWQAADTIGKWSSNFTCREQYFCGTDFNFAEFEQAADAIYKHQHPKDCRTAKFLVVEKEFESGLGSTINAKASMFLFALSVGRVLIDHPDIVWGMTNPKTCTEQDWSCYFAPLTNCTLPANWVSAAEPLIASWTNQSSQFLTAPVRHKTPRLPLIGFGFDDRLGGWWGTHAVMYLIRPSMRTLQATCLAWACMSQGAREPPRPFASMFVRGGDKWKEARLRDPYEYFDLLAWLNSKLSEPVRMLYVGTDDAYILQKIARNYSGSWNLHWIGYNRDHGGLTLNEVMSRHNSSRAEWQVLLSLADLYITASADIFVGTLSSNWCRLADRIRHMQGKAQMPYVTPERKTPLSSLMTA